MISPAIPDCPDSLASTWNWWRDQMPVTKKWAYFDHAAVAPLSAPAAGVLRSFAEAASENGDVPWLDWSAQAETLRMMTSELIHCEPSEVALVPNTTTGINWIAEGFPWRAGDSVVVPEGEFPSNAFPWMNQQTKGVEVRAVARRDGRVLVEDLINRCDESTKMISVSWVGYASGYRVDLNELVEQAHRRGVLVFVDAIQGMGMYPLDLRECDVDFLAADGHKWMLGPEGAGVAVIRKRHLDMLRNTAVGWASVKNSHNYSNPSLDLRDEAARFEVGSANLPGLMALSASMAMFVAVKQRHGADAIQNRVLERATTLRTKLEEAGARPLFDFAGDLDCGSGIVTFEVPGVSPAEFRKSAIDGGAVVSCRGGGVRASVHVYNDDEDLDRLAGLVAKCI